MDTFADSPDRSATDGHHDVRAALLDHPLLAVLNEQEREEVADVAHLRRHDAGTTLIAQGSDPGPLVLLLDGRLEVRRDGREVALLGPGTWVGEIGLLQHGPSSADVVALDDLLVAEIDHEDATALLEVDAVALQLDAVARRRRATNRALEAEPISVTTPTGVETRLRPVWPSDWRLFTVDQDRVSQESLRMRFFTPLPLTERTFRRLTAIDLHSQFAWAAFVDDRLSGIGRYALSSEDRGIAELALLVADDVQRQGLGTLLVTAIVVAADVHGADELLASARAENVGIHALLDRFGGRFEPGGEEGIVRARWPIEEALAALPPDVPVDELRAVAETILAPVVED